MTRLRLLRALLAFWLLSMSAALAAPIIVIDAGHGGHDRGGMPGQHIAEKIYTLDVARRLQHRLRSLGYRTVMTRSGDYFVKLNHRCAIANRYPGCVFISVHFNGARREGANGIETYFYGRASAGLARAVHSHVLRAAGSENRHVRRRGFYVLRKTRGVAVLAECGFLTNRAEARRIMNAGHRQRLADGLARAIISRYR